MSTLRRYRKRPEQAITAVKLELDTQGLHYHKWGSEQHGKPGDWLVDNQGDIYTIDAEVFRRTYRPIGPGRYVKTEPVWAQQVTSAGSIRTMEGESYYLPGDYLVYNNEDRTDGYCIAQDKFLTMYEADDSQ